MVTLKASYTVKPAKQTPTKLMYLSEFDQFITRNHVPTVYFYRPRKESLPNAAEILTDSLSKALVIFYPLAGRLQAMSNGRLELNCNSNGALFVEAESESKMADFGDFSPSPEIRALAPSVETSKPIHEWPLLFVQLTKFGCGGISIGLAVSHVLVDGLCAAHFVSEWARIARGEQPQNTPFLDRTILKLDGPLPPQRFHHSEFSPPPILLGHSSGVDEGKKETSVAMLKLRREQIDLLKKKADDDHHQTSIGASRRGFTRNEVVTAHVWRCGTRSRQHEKEQLTGMYMSVDVRSRMDPPLPDWYFGNAVLPEVAMAASGDIASKPLGYASSKIREALEKVSDEYVRSSVAFLKGEEDLSKLGYFRVPGRSSSSSSGEERFFVNPNMTVTSWTKIPLCGVDFGWGKEIYMGPGTIGHDGKTFVLSGYGDDGEEDGSCIVALRLQVAHMDDFKKFFYEGL